MNTHRLYFILVKNDDELVGPDSSRFERQIKAANPLNADHDPMGKLKVPKLLFVGQLYA